MTSEFQLTYGTLFNPPEELHTRFEKAAGCMYPAAFVYLGE